MARYINCFKSYEIRNMLDSSGDYEIKLIDECNGKGIRPSKLSKINDYLEKYNLHVLYTLVPYFYAEESFEDITQNEAEKIVKQFINPSKCINYVEEHKILEKIAEDKLDGYEEMILVLENLVSKWREGYYVYEWD